MEFDQVMADYKRLEKKAFVAKNPKLAAVYAVQREARDYFEQHNGRGHPQTKQFVDMAVARAVRDMVNGRELKIRPQERADMERG